MTLLEAMVEAAAERRDTKPLTEAEARKEAAAAGADLVRFFAKRPGLSPLVKLGLGMLWGVSSVLAIDHARKLDEEVAAARRALEEQRPHG